MLLRICVLIAFCFFSTALAAETNWQENRLVPLEKLTVGPWDNFEASIGDDDQRIYFTHSQNQIPNILQQDLQRNETTLLIGKIGDAKEPALNPAGTTLAFTYFGNDAQGDVCLFTLANKALKCITTNATLDKSPFWVNDHLLGYLSRDTAQIDWNLVLHDLATGTATTLYHGLISAPAATPDGRYILLTEALPDGVVRLQAWDRQQQKMLTPTKFDLPGITGIATVTSDAEYLYFNQYLNDTNGDQVIDGSDNSVAFRIPFATWLHSTKPLLPEQLTSVSSNCKFPDLSKRYLYLTCAFEGSLDIYRLPLTGSVPPQWDQQRLLEAHRSARSHETRLLLLNSLRYRFGRNDTEMLERLLSNHLEIGELTAARYYVKQLQQLYRQQNDEATAHFYEALDMLFLVRASKQKVPVGIVTARFRRIVDKARQHIHASKLPAALTTLIDAWFDFELEDEPQALQRLQRYDLSRASALPLERVIAFELYRQLLTQHPKKLLGIYPLMFDSASLPAEARIYYGFNYLKLLSRTEKNISTRIDTIERQLDNIHHNEIAQLFRSEIQTLRLVLSSDQASRNTAFQALNTLLKNNRDDLLLRKAMHVRAIQNLGAAEQFQYMELLSRHWLLTTNISEMEFANVAEQYAIITMDKAYGMLAAGNAAKAYAVFYSAIRQTNDLEAHYQFITLGLSPSLDKRENLERSYAILKKQNLLGQHANYAEALKLILDADSSRPEAMKTTLKKALALLEPMNNRGLSPAVRDLLMGYIHHQLLRLSKHGYRYDKRAFQKAHYHYIMALDLGRDNSRITASVWENLAWLHSEVRNQALAVDFFARRLALPFPNGEDEARTRLAFARALFANNQPQEAQQQAAKALSLATTSSQLDRTPFLEKYAFYALQAEDYPQAIQSWGKLLTTAQLGDENRAKALLGYGYALMKIGIRETAKQQFEAVLAIANKLKPLPADHNRLIPFTPTRFKLLASGFLATLSTTPGDRIHYRAQRTQLLQSLAGQSETLAWKESTRLSLLAKDYQHIAVSHEAAGQYAQMAAAMDQSLQAATAWAEETDDPIGPVIYRTLINYLSLGLSHPQYVDSKSAQRLRKQCNKTLQAFKEQSWQPAAIISRHTRLALLFEAWQAKALQHEPESLSEKIDALLDTPALQQLKIDNPEMWQALTEIANGVSGG